MTRRVIITWPKPGEHVSMIKLVDADTGEKLVTVTKLTVVADCNDGPGGSQTAEMTMLANADGQYLRSGEPVVSDGQGGYRMTVERWDIAEMRSGS